MDLIKTAKKFIEDNWDRESPLLLGYSGGPDSKALLYALLEAGISQIHLAHVDHGWREQSRAEAEMLREEAASLNLFFHSIRLAESPVKNLEEHGRLARLKFFKKLMEEIPFQALLLAHQLEDRAETMLKRLFEGAHLPYLTGLAPISHLEGIDVWRPFLPISKKEIFSFLQSKGLVAISDPTNYDPRFLRTRLRTEIIPYLSEQFGKEIGGNLALCSERAGELKKYLDERVQHVWEGRIEENGQIVLNCSGLARIEARHLIQKIVSFSRELLEEVLDSLFSNSKNRSYVMKGQTIVVNRGGIQINLNPNDSILAGCKLIQDSSRKI